MKDLVIGYTALDNVICALPAPASQNKIQPVFRICAEAQNLQDIQCALVKMIPGDNAILVLRRLNMPHHFAACSYSGAMKTSSEIHIRTGMSQVWRWDL